MLAMKTMSRRSDNQRSILGHLSQILAYNSPAENVIMERRLQSVDAKSTRSDSAVFRKATEADIPGILALSRRSLGEDYTSDYLPGWLPKALKDNNRIVTVGEQDNVIVAFGMGVCGVDRGRTLVGEAGRVAPEARDLGLTGQTINFLVTECIKKYPQYERLRSSSLLVDFFDKNLDKINLLAKRVYTEIHITAEQMAMVAASVSRHSVSIRKLSDVDYQEILSDKAITKRLYPKGLIAAGFHVFDAEPSNVQFITYFHNNILMNTDHNAISLGGLFPCNDNQSWRYNFNYSGVVDLVTCLVHLVEHLKLVAKVTDGKDVYVFVSIDKAFKNLFGKETIVHSLRDTVGVNKESIVVRMQYQYEFV